MRKTAVLTASTQKVLLSGFQKLIPGFVQIVWFVHSPIPFCWEIVNSKYINSCFLTIVFLINRNILFTIMTMDSAHSPIKMKKTCLLLHINEFGSTWKLFLLSFYYCDIVVFISPIHISHILESVILLPKFKSWITCFNFFNPLLLIQLICLCHNS